jgi:hypothetical protein
VRDGVLLRLIGKWLNAGVLEGGVLSYPESGSPQGGVISPLLSNVYLHYVLDVWFEEEVKPRLRGRAFLIRYADDCAPRRRSRKGHQPAGNAMLRERWGQAPRNRVAGPGSKSPEAAWVKSSCGERFGKGRR